MVFKATPDKLCRMISLVISIVFLLVIATALGSFIITGHALLVVPSLVLGAVYLCCYLYHPVQYETTHEQVVIVRPIKSIRINKSDIQSCEPLDDVMFKRSIRTFGVGGLFGYYGSFANTNLGSMTWYATRRTSGILIITSGNKRVVITPDNREALLAQLQS